MPYAYVTGEGITYWYDTTSVYSMQDVEPTGGWDYQSVQNWEISVTPAQEQIWRQWTTVGTASSVTYNNARQQDDILRRTEEIEARRSARRQEWVEQRRREDAEHRRRVQEEAARMQAAEQHALQLLRLVLSNEEWNEYERHTQVTLTGSDGIRYRVRMSGSCEGNVYQLNEDGVSANSICCHPRMWEYMAETGQQFRIPTMDAYIAQIMAIRHNAEEFLQIGNISGRRVDPPRLPEVVAA